MSDTDVIVRIRSALRAQLLTVATLPLIRKWETQRCLPREPQLTDPWMRETMLRPPGGPTRMNPGPFARMRLRGNYQVDLLFPPNPAEGAKQIESVAGDVKTAFPDTLELLFEGQRVTCLGSGIGSIVEEPNWVILPVMVTWRADTYNAT